LDLRDLPTTNRFPKGHDPVVALFALYCRTYEEVLAADDPLFVVRSSPDGWFTSL